MYLYRKRNITYKYIGNLEESLLLFDKAIEKEPSVAAVSWQRGLTLFYLNKYDEGTVL